ncbi:MAG: glycosyltransferase family 2 protein [Anaerolineales bacterium]
MKLWLLAEKEKRFWMLRLRKIIGEKRTEWIRKYIIPRGSKRDQILRLILQIILPQSDRSISYSQWIKKHEPSKKELLIQSQISRTFRFKPLVSIIMPVYNPPPKILEKAIQSVLAQTYYNWELCIADASVGNNAVKKILRRYKEFDPRIKLLELEQNLGIAGNTNAAIHISQGEYVGFLDHDDELAPFALFEVVSRLQSNPEIMVFYSDEDKITPNGQRHSPFFKPGFSPDLLRSVNYACHFLVVERNLGNRIGWLREGFEGAQDFDLILRLMEQTDKIVRIPKILYHWREVPGSTATSVNYKPNAHNAGKKALTDHIRRSNMNAKVEDTGIPTLYRVSYHAKGNPLISIIILNCDHALDLERCVHSIETKSTYKNYEILIIENNSKEKETFRLYEHLVQENKRIRVLEWNYSFNYHKVNNWAVKSANGEILLFLNNDTEVISNDWLEQMLMHATRDDIGTVGAKLYYPDDTIQHAGIILGIAGFAGHGYRGFPRSHPGLAGQLFLVRNVMANTGACLMVDRNKFDMVKGFDESYILALGDVDLCLKLFEKGYLNLWTPYAELYHHESKTRGYEDTPEKQKRFLAEVEYFRRKWLHLLEKGDPYYNPNLSLEYEDYRIKG